MQTHSAKQQAIEAIEQLPDNVALEEIVYGPVRNSVCEAGFTLVSS